MRVSVVINTCNRAESLRRTLLSLEHQTYPDFEVIVVAGPSTDDTALVLDEFADRIRVYDCPERRLSVSRNIGILHSAGEIVAFIDDDSLATPYWVEELVNAYDAPDVGAAGGLVYDPSGVSLQYRFAACHRDGTVASNVSPPLDTYLRPEADPVAYLQGTNMSFRRDALAAVGGFDENICHFYDDVDTCLRVIDAGFRLKPLEDAAVHHKFLASHVRDHRRITLDPFNLLSDRVYFGLRHGRNTRSTREILASCVGGAEAFRREADGQLSRGELTTGQWEHIYRRVEEGFDSGLTRGMRGIPAVREITPPSRHGFRQYPTRRPAGRRLRVCFVSKEYPPGDFGGPGRYTHELACGFAAAGHDVHVITRTPDVARVDWEDGAWVHRIASERTAIPELATVAAREHVVDMASVYREVCRVHAERPLDIVMCPLWLCEALACTFDDRFPTAITLITAMKAVSTLAEWARSSDGPAQLIRFEEEWVKRADYLHAVSHAIRERAVTDYAADPQRSFLAPLGVKDRRPKYSAMRVNADRIRILYVGRLEARKGADVFLDAAARLVAEFPNIEFVLAGKELPTDRGDTHRERFESRFASDADMRSRVSFSGMVTDDELYQHYADCDIFCLPTHYESFGLVYVEAMMWGKPLVGSHVGGVPEVVCHGEQGYLCPVGDVDAVVDALRRLILDPELRDRFGRRSRELFETRWALPVAVDRLAQEIEAIGARHRAKWGTFSNPSPSHEAVRNGFAGILTTALALTPEAARAVATQLIGPSPTGQDLSYEIQRCWDEPLDIFVVAAYRIVLDRTPAEGELPPWRDLVANGLSRFELLRTIVNSDEARRRGRITIETLVPASFLATVQSQNATSASRALTQTPAAAPLAVRLRRRLSRLPLAGVLLRYARRLLVLPWTTQKLYESQVVTQQHLHTLLSQLSAIRAETTSASARLEDRQNENQGLSREHLLQLQDLARTVHNAVDRPSDRPASRRELATRPKESERDGADVLEFPTSFAAKTETVPGQRRVA